MKSTSRTLAIFATTCAASALTLSACSSKMESKFSKASQGVSNEVNFSEGGADRAAPSPNRAAAPKERQEKAEQEEVSAAVDQAPVTRSGKKDALALNRVSNRADSKIAPSPKRRKIAPSSRRRKIAPSPSVVPKPSMVPGRPVDANDSFMPPSDSNAGTEGYKDYGVNKMTQTTQDRFSTFSIDVDTGSYTIARRKLQEGWTPPAAAVRVEEFVNYFKYNYPQPDAGAFGVYMEGAPSPFDATGTRTMMRVAVQGVKIPAAKRKPVHLTFLVDTSGSMNRPDKLGLAKESLRILTSKLGPKDSVALATYAGSTSIKLRPTSASAKNKKKIIAEINQLSSRGGTAMSSGMKAAYDLATAAMKPGHVNRVIVLSDGDANIGRTSHKQILQGIRSHVEEGITMSTIGFGMGNYKDTMMEQLANKGNGNYYYIDSREEALKVFGEQADGTLEVIAKDVKIQVEFNPKAVQSYRLIGYENRDIADKDFRDDTVDAGEIGSGHTVTALYELIRIPESTEKQLAKVMVRHKEPQGHKASEQTFMFTQEQMHSKLGEASNDFQFATAVASFAEVLRKSPYASHISFDLIKEIATGATRHDQKDRKEFITLVDRAKSLKASNR